MRRSPLHGTAGGGRAGGFLLGVVVGEDEWTCLGALLFAAAYLLLGLAVAVGVWWWTRRRAAQLD